MSRGALSAIELTRLRGNTRAGGTDWVIEEWPIAFEYNGVAHAVMLATPTDLSDFALGFSLGEGIVEQPGEMDILAVREQSQGWVVEIALDDARFDMLQSRRRSLLGTSGCGLCGTESLASALRPAPTVPMTQSVTPGAIAAACAALGNLQPMNLRSGGVHAAAWVSPSGLLVREDVGRHNALDKLIGARARAPLQPGFLLLSSRASYELVHKAAMAGIEILVAISAPTALAIRFAESTGITLIAFARGEQMNVYANAGRVVCRS